MRAAISSARLSDGEDAPDQPDRLHSELFRGPRSGGLALLRDLHDLYLMATECDIAWTLVGQAAQGVRDRELLAVYAALAMALEDALGRTVLPLGRRTPIKAEPGIRDEL